MYVFSSSTHLFTLLDVFPELRSTFAVFFTYGEIACLIGDLNLASKPLGGDLRPDGNEAGPSS